mmetsp:Transcript_46193/g.33963  ORF Transcript_46193/g.33963 Transcript_46193/m.33963 type:complete len:128 (+) Transcript_46193:509-892(+)
MNLIDTRDKLNKQLEDLKNEVTAYEKTMKTNIMSLNNDIANLQGQYEQIEDQMNRLKSDAEENNKKKRHKTGELAKILMAINNMEKRCLGRKSVLAYPLDKTVNKYDPGYMGGTQELFKARAEYAKY